MFRSINTNSPFIWRFIIPHELLKHSELSLKTVQLPCINLFLLWTLVAVRTSLWDWHKKQGLGCIPCFNNCCPYPSFSGWMGSTAQVAELWVAKNYINAAGSAPWNVPRNSNPLSCWSRTWPREANTWQLMTPNIFPLETGFQSEEEEVILCLLLTWRQDVTRITDW